MKLNPLLGHIAWERNTDNQWEIYIPIDGWIALIHREPSFQGISFNQSAEIENGIPIWMECTIHRSNLINLITVREYYSELKTEHPMWTQMPRRMLRHKTLKQSARLVWDWLAGIENTDRTTNYGKVSDTAGKPKRTES